MVLQRITRPIAAGIGLGQEAYAHNKEKKAAKEAGQSTPSTNNVPSTSDGPPACPDEKKHLNVNEHSEDEDDEDLWVEDDAQAQIVSAEPRATNKKQSVEEWVQAFVHQHPLPKTPINRLPAPVVLPQRRPGMRTRGFVRAYAPDLEASGIDQNAWLQFVDGFHDSTSQQGYFNVTNIAVALSVLTYTAQFGPSLVVHLSALAVHSSIEAGRRLYISKKTNSYLDEINNYYFQPRGLYAMVMQYDPDSKDSTKVLDFGSLSANAVSKSDNEDKSTRQKFSGSSGKTLESQIPEVCPLVFPDLENAPEEQQKNAFMSAIGFARDYGDRREQAMFDYKNPDSKLSHERKPFAGNFGDPVKFQQSGFIGLLTGGKVDPRSRRKERRQRIREETGRGRRRGPIRTGIQTVKKTFSQGVLYVLVVNMPTEEEMKIAKEMEEKMKAEEPNWWEKFQAARGSRRAY